MSEAGLTGLQDAMRNVDRDHPSDGGARPTVEAIAAAALLAQDDAFADAHRIVSRSIKRGGRDASEPTAADAAAIRTICHILLGVQAQQ